MILNQYRQASFPPLYPVFLAGLRRMGIGSIRDIRLVQAFLGAGSCLWLMGIAHRAFSRHENSLAISVVAALLLAVYPPAIWYGRQVMTETVFMFLLLSGIYCLFRSIESKRMHRWLAGAGIFFGLGILCRPTLLPFAFVIPLWIVMVRPDVRFRRVISYLVPLALIMAPWGARNYRLFHRVIPVTTQAGNILYLANNPLASGGTVSISYYLQAGIYHLGDEEDELTYNQEYGRRAVDFITASPMRFLRLCLRRLAWFYHLDGHHRRPVLLVPFWGVIVLAIAGFWLARERWKATFPLLLLVINFTAIHMVFPPEGRYRLPVMPAFFLFAAVALIEIYTRLGGNHE
ncbi:MAG: glycosyltransferase family 39 protein [PVC group bacterium]